VPSIEELAFLIDKGKYFVWQEMAGDADTTTILSLKEDIIPLADKALAMGTKSVLLKCGIAGMYLKNAKDHSLPGWGGFAAFQDSFVADRVLSAVGSGDASIAGFLAAMLSGGDPAACLELSAAEGAACVTEYDTTSGLLPLDRLKAKIRAGWKTNSIVRA